jgi:hypothetical protein
MRRFPLKIIIAGIFLSLSTQIEAQVTFGIKGGMGLSTFNATKVSSPDLSRPFYYGQLYNYTLTYSAGMLWDIKLGKALSLRPELLYIQRGFQASQNLGNNNYRKTTYKMGYIEVPLNLVIGSELRPGRLEVYTGLAVGCGIEGHGTTQTSLITQDFYLRADTQRKKDDANNIVGFNRFNVSINLGISYKLNRALLQLGYNWGLSNIQPHYEDQTLEDKRSGNVIKSSSFTLGLAYLFHKKKNK